MSITFNNNIFTINTENTTYAFELLQGRYLRHIYYGRKTNSISTPKLKAYSFAPYIDKYGHEYSPDTLENEISFFGSGDFRATSLRILGSDGSSVTDFVYKSYRIFNGRYEIKDLPKARCDNDTETLEITLFDIINNCNLYLYYTVFQKTDVISRYIRLENLGDGTLKIEKCMSLELTINNELLDMVSFFGSPNNEMQYERLPVRHGLQTISSIRGSSSHHHNPFIALCNRDATETDGDVFGFNFTYSGSFANEVELDYTGTAKVLIGLGSETFGYILEKGKSFTSPEAVMTYSSCGFGKMTRNFHSFIRNNIMPKNALKPHPVVLNTWEAVFFDINEKKLIDFADEAAKTGFDMLVMDDGWFGNRAWANAGLGDWIENKEKFPRGLKAFVRDVKSKGIKFGIWIEPEMVNPNSELYRAHPEWALAVPGREALQSRYQLVLDMSNNDVIDYLIKSFTETFDGIEIDYFKWDMNRNLCNAYSSNLPPEKQCEVSFRFMKGTYKLLNWFSKKYPNAVIETCSGGGGRYDLGMMQYGIQIWASDNTIPEYRTFIQSSALIGYPAATMSCHVSNPGNDLKSLDFRYKVAVGGMLGYELNILEMSEEVKKEISRQINEYKSFEHIILLGDYYKLASPIESEYSAYYYVTDDNSEILLSIIETEKAEKGKSAPLVIERAIADKVYTDLLSGKEYSGNMLKEGIALDIIGEKHSGVLMHLKVK